LADTAPPRADAHRELFGAPVRFGAARTEVHWPRSVLDLPVLAADPALQALFESRLREASATLASESEPAAVARAREIIMARLEHGDVSLDLVARELAVSRRSLQRRLSEAGTTFQELLDASRRALAFRHLKSRDTSVEEVAFLTGFSEPSAFFRAFRRWTGTTPNQWRGARRP
jgi:AraC-like DNA-binding protein